MAPRDNAAILAALSQRAPRAATHVKFDVAIVGAGPAGAMAAYELANSGLKVAVLESAELPRLKPCGGLMPGWVKTLTELPLDDLIDHTVSRFDYLYNFEQPCTRQDPNWELLLADRARFDAGIMALALQRGSGSVTLFEGWRVDGAEEFSDSVVLTCKTAKSIAARAVIAADGASSRVARSLGMAPLANPAAAIDASIRVSDEFYRQVADRVIFNYFYLPAGYGWIFPKGNNLLACGVGSWSARKLPLKKIMQRYIADSIGQRHIHSITQHGHPIPAYSGSRQLATARVCLAGDAAGLVDPVSGEGIRNALHSGMLAASAVRDFLADQDSSASQGLDCTSYQHAISTGPEVELNELLRMAVLPFQQAPDFYYRTFIQRAEKQPHYNA